MEQKNQLVKATSTLSKIGNRIQIELTQGVPMRTLENAQPIKDALKYVFVLIGIRGDNLPNEEAKQVLIDFCRRRYGNFTARELVIAFEMAISGDFKAETEHFGQFTPKYLASILNAYTEHRNKVMIEIEQQKENERKQQSEEEIQKQVEAFLNEAKDLYRESDGEYKGTKYHANVLYDELKGNYTEAELIDFKQKAGSELQALKDEYEKKKRRREPIGDYLKSITFTKSEWRRRTALKVVNDALNRNIEL